VFGSTCANIEDCVRHEPEYAGYASPDAGWAWLIVLTTIAVVLGLFVLAVVLCRRRDRRYYEHYNKRVVDDTLASLDYMEMDRGGENGQAEGLLGAGGRGTPPADVTCSRCSLCTAFLVVLVVVLMVLALLFVPRRPLYSLCRKSIDWSDIFYNLAHGGLAGGVDMHFSVWNGNRFSVHITQATASFYYKKVLIGHAMSGNVTLPAGSIADIMLSAHFFASMSLALEMYTAHYLGTLLLDVMVDLDSDVRLASQPLLHYRTNLTVPDVNVGSGDDSLYCKCKS
jgi:hypothetical protein